MRAKVITRRKGGRNLHRDELSQLPPIVGELRIKEEHDRVLHRHLVRARLLDISKGTEHDLLPSLTEAIGTERVDHAEFGQTWAVELS